MQKNQLIAPGAHIIGAVRLGENVGIWYNAVVRGDSNTIIIGDNTNVQDNTTIHTDTDFPVQIGTGVTIGHNAIIHGCTIGDNTVIGMGSIVLSGAVIAFLVLVLLSLEKHKFLTTRSPLEILQSQLE